MKPLFNNKIVSCLGILERGSDCMRCLRFFLFIWLTGIVTISLQAQTVADRIIAVVDNEIILESELNSQAQMYAMQQRIDPQQLPLLKEQMLESMINKRLLLAKAIRDTVVVSDAEIQQELDNQMRQFEQIYGSIDLVAEQMGMSVPRLRREMREDIRKELLVQRLQSKTFQTINVSRREVRNFYQQHRTELPPVPEQVEVAHIFIMPEEDENVRADVYARAEQLRDSILAGADFEALAKQYSVDTGTAERGGDLGWVRRGLFVREFEEAVFAMSPGEVSEVVETPFGLHIIRLEERRGDSVRPRHILLRIERSEESDRPTIDKLNEIRRRVLGGESFEDLAKENSQDTDTAPFGGTLGTLPTEQLETDIRRVVSDLSEGQISDPARINLGEDYGYSIIKLNKRIPQSEIDFDRDYQFLERFATQYKMESEFEKLIDNLRNEIYWEKKL
jgi:peptidyl-prolyl cis-trans isomerase SurA